jgi:hypothetical protein
MQVRMKRQAAALVLLLAVSGCGSELVNASGRLTYNGHPVPSTLVMFQPDDGSRRSTGVTDDDGQFTLRFSRTQTGVKRGPHTVVLKYEVSAAEELDRKKSKASKELKAVIARYADPKKSKLHYDVTENGQFFDIKLE